MCAEPRVAGRRGSACGPAAFFRDDPMFLWIKALHVIFVVSWFAGLFYLPRIYVNLAMVGDGPQAQAER